MDFLKRFFIYCILLFLIISAFILSIDPYDKYGINVFGFKHKAVMQSRDYKFQMLETSDIDYKGFILGSSAAHRFHTEDIKEILKVDVFNYSVQHTTTDDYKAQVNHLLERYNPKFIILNIDFTALDESFDTDNRLYNSSLKKYLFNQKTETHYFDSDYLSLRAIADSFNVIGVNLWGKVTHKYLENGNYINEINKTNRVNLKQSSYPHYKISKKRVSDLLGIKKRLTERNIDIYVLISPLSIEHLRKILDNPNLSKIHNQFKQELSSIFPNVWDFENLGISDYSTPQYFIDSTHPTRSLFKVISKKIFDHSSTNLGTRL